MFTKFCLQPKRGASKLPSLLKKLPQSTSHVVLPNLVLSPFDNSTLDELTALASPKLIQLSLVLHNPREDHEGALEMSLRITNWLSMQGMFLQELSITGILDTVGDDGICRVSITLPNLPSLQALTLGVSYSPLTFHPFLTDQFPRLNTLDLSSCSESFSLFSSSVLPTVKKLVINIRKSEEHLPWEVMFPNLEVLDLSMSLSHRSNYSMRVAFKFKNLIQLSFQGGNDDEDKWNLLLNSKTLHSRRPLAFYNRQKTVEDCWALPTADGVNCKWEWKFLRVFAT